MRWLFNFYIPFSNSVELLSKEQNPFVSANFNFNSMLRSFLFRTTPNSNDDIVGAPALFSNELFMIVSAAELADWSSERKVDEYAKRFNDVYPPFVKLPMEKMINSLHYLADWRYRLEKPNRYATNYNGSLLMLHGTLGFLLYFFHLFIKKLIFCVF